ncbi:MAG: hypothetical protein JOZ78_12840 [Chroococcidiopsidaceae cyanobacterium CP_BM_ER_R8_30]|nr:hypothetical protein [Chroococcidiopsidaceae cyanobacterium CP_BM_ER_R8_30]
MQQQAKRKRSSRRNLWFERLMALIATVNLGLVLFNLSYVPWRDFWLTGSIHILGFALKIPLPPITNWYDPIKGIEPYDETREYLNLVDALEEQVIRTGLQSPSAAVLLKNLRRQSQGKERRNLDALVAEVSQPKPTLPPAALLEKLRRQSQGEERRNLDTLIAQASQAGLQTPNAKALLEQLQSQSVEMVDSNWFAIARKEGSLVKIKNRMRHHIPIPSKRGGQKKSATQAFISFWTPENLSGPRWQQEIGFFNREIRPLIAANYYRPLGENGQPVDLFFWKIDIWFIALFGAEFLARTFYLSRSHTALSWIDAMLWRWYDIFLLLPFLRLLRVIPVTIRLHQAELLDLGRVEKQVSHGLVATLAEELTQVVVVRVINQIQGSIERGDVTRFLQRSPNRRPDVQLREVGEVDAMANLMVQLIVYQVLPKIEPDIKAIVQHNIEGVLSQIPLYNSLQNLLGLVPIQLPEQLAEQVTQAAYGAIVAGMEDQVGAKLSSQLMQHFSEALGVAVQKEQTLQEIQSLMLDLLDEVKFNYIKRLHEEDVEKALEETRRLQFKARAKQTAVQDSLVTSLKEDRKLGRSERMR